jgi:hypothetical protein
MNRRAATGQHNDLQTKKTPNRRCLDAILNPLTMKQAAATL